MWSEDHMTQTLVSKELYKCSIYFSEWIGEYLWEFLGEKGLTLMKIN